MADAEPTLVDRVIEAFGGLTATARALGHTNVTTVHSWKTSWRLPHWRQHEIRSAATRLSVTLPNDFPPDAAPASQDDADDAAPTPPQAGAA